MEKNNWITVLLGCWMALLACSCTTKDPLYCDDRVLCQKG